MTTLTAATPMMGGGLLPGPMVRPGAPAAGGLTGADVLRIFRQRLVLILVVWLFFCGLTAAFTWFMARYYPTYTARSNIRVESTEPINMLNPLERRIQPEKQVELLLQNQALLVKSRNVLEDAIKDPAVRETSWYAWALGEKNEDPVDLLGDIISAAPARDSNYLLVSAGWRVPKEVPVLVNTVVRKYLARVDYFQRQGMKRTQEQLEAEFNRAEKLYEGKRRELEELRAGAEVMGLPDGGPSEQLLTLEALVTELEVEMIGRKTQWEALSNARPEDLPITAELQAILQADPMINLLERSFQDADANLRIAEARYGENHPVVKNARIAQGAADQRVAEERATKLLRFQQEQIEQARRNYLEAEEQSMALKERLFEARAEQRDRDAKFARYLRLMEEQDLLRAQYEALLEQRNLISMTSRQQAVVQIEVHSEAVTPKRRSSPQWLIWMPAGIVLGLAVSFGLAFLLEMADKSVRTPRDVPRVPVLGTIPAAEDDEVEIAQIETAAIDAPHSIVAEAFRNLRANLFFSAPAEQQGVILVTSPSGGNGKTTVASNLAISIALSGRRVLLIDANFRRPALAKLFSGIHEQGLSNILIGQGRLSDLVVATNVPGLDVLGAGPTPPNPAELLGSSYLRDVIVDARSRYDQVIFDGPPVLLVSDSMVLAGAVDGVLVVCQYRATSRGAFQRTQNQLEAMNARVFGGVLNRVETRAGGYFRKVYREFYEYQSTEALATSAAPRLEAADAAAKGGNKGKTAKAAAPPELGAAPPPAAAAVAAEPPPAIAPPSGPDPLDLGTAAADVAALDEIDLDEDLKIRDDFDLGEDLDNEPEEPRPAT